jgi:flavin-binding protein dodecin
MRHPRAGLGEAGVDGDNDAMIIARRAGLSPSRGRQRQDEHGGIMTDRTYRVTEIVGTSAEGLDPAIRNALHRAAQTLRHLDWFEVTQIRGQIEDGRVAHYQVGLKVGFRLEDT